MIRVLHILGGMNQGGTENFLMNLYRSIDKEKVQFDFLVNRVGVFDEEIKSLGGNIYYIPALQNIGQFKYTKNLDKFFKEHSEYKIIHSHLNQVTGLILERAKKANIPVRIAHSHNSKSNKNLVIKNYKKYLQSKILKNATNLWACSKLAAQWLYGKKEINNVDIIPNAIDAEKFIYKEETRKKLRKEFNINEDAFVIGNIARMSYQKNHMFLIKIFYELKKIEKEAKMVIVGNGEEKEKIISEIKHLNLENDIILLEDRKDVNEILQMMDYFVFPSRFEGLGIVLIEAQTAGLKCITSKDVVPSEVAITDLVEFYSLKKSPKEWAKKIYLHKKYDRENQLQKIRKANYDVKNLIEKIQKKYITYYNETKEKKC